MVPPTTFPSLPSLTLLPIPAQMLNRTQKDCRSKWTTLQRSVVIQDMRKGPFVPSEDALLLLRVSEWGDRGQVGHTIVILHHPTIQPSNQPTFFYLVYLGTVFVYFTSLMTFMYKVMT
jgi:hypothetical protein